MASIACLALPALAQAQAAAAVENYDKLLQGFCVDCHNTEDWAGGLAMETLDLQHVSSNAKEWETAVRKLRGRLMPPAGRKQPAQADIDAMVKYLETSLDAPADTRTIGHVPIQRLNRTEFAASVKDLLDVEVDPRQVLPTEIEVEGFSNIAGALNISPAFLEQFLSASRRVARLAIGEPVPKLAKVTVPALPASVTDFPLGTRGGTSRGGVSFSHVFPADGEYRFIVPEEDFLNMGLYPRGAQTAATLVILIDGVEMVRKDIGGPEYIDLADRDGAEGRKAILAMVASSAQVTAGRHQVAMTYVERSRSLNNDTTSGGSFIGGNFGGNIGGQVSDMPIIQTAIEIEGPIAPHGLSMSESRERIFVCEPQTPAEELPCAERIARHLGAEAYRRPVTDADVQLLMKSYELGRQDEGGFDAGVTELVTAVLSSPDFLYRSISASTQPQETRLLTDLELAARLSFFLWSTGPDQELLNLATSKKLSDPVVMQAQVMRMLKDDRANALVENFAMGWLNLDELDQVDPTENGFNDAMRKNFETEIRLFLASVLLENRGVADLLNADWTFVNEALARQYDIPGVRGAQFRRVQLTNENRFGLLGKGAVLLRTSYSDRTSPVLRGAWVLDKLMGTPPAPPPPAVNTDLSIKEGEKPTTVRARLELHRQAATCNACHGLIDPPGLALENFDNTGHWRTTDSLARTPIDSNTELTSGKKIAGPTELRKHLLSQPDQLPQNVTRRLMMYAMNREMEYFDMPEVRRIVRDAAAGGYKFNDLIMGVVNSEAFRRQGADVTPQMTTMASAQNP
ncbi:MAG: DUF1592 domain-containing protein [Nevskiaceae bacterium]|jgi:mono/diheme cytochrome c family protein|nr:DUF1592 domain-containing protein [Nevskiaceae bacterium]